MRSWLCVAVVIAGCSKHDNASSEQAYVENEIGAVERALASSSETEVTIGCVSLNASRKRMEPKVVARIEQLCDVEVPRLLLRKAIADVAANNAEHPDLGDLNCMQLFAGDAFKAMARRSAVDPELQKLAAEYERLCPKQVEKIRQKLATGSGG